MRIVVLTLTAWAAITISLKKVLLTTSDLERGIAVPRFVFNLTALVELGELIMPYMKQLSLMLLILFSVGLTNCAKATPPEKEQTKEEQTMYLPFKLYPTDNMWTFIKLDTRNGKMWQVQFSVKGDDYRFEMPLNMTVLAADSTNGRFELYPTQNMFNFVLLDRIGGATWQVQWSTEPENQAVIPIKQSSF